MAQSFAENDVDRLLEVIHAEAHAVERCNKECELWHRLTRLPRWPIEAWIEARIAEALAESNTPTPPVETEEA